MNSLLQHLFQLRRRLLSLLRRGRYEREMEEEMRFHLELATMARVPGALLLRGCVDPKQVREREDFFRQVLGDDTRLGHI